MYIKDNNMLLRHLIILLCIKIELRTKIIIMDNYQIIKCIAIVKQSDSGDYGFANFLYKKLFSN